MQFVSKLPVVSRLYGWWQRLPLSRRKVLPFIQKYQIDASEFEQDPSHFRSFDAFFIRHLKKSVRPIASGNEQAIIPADGRYRFYPDLSVVDGLIVKGKRFSLEELLKDDALASRYFNGTAVLGRLCPTDYHRFHFPCDAFPGEAKLIKGALYSVNPIALKRNIRILVENRRMVTELKTEAFGKVLYVEVGATNVGAIHQTYTPFEQCRKGQEKGYFSFGGSALILLFEPGRLTLSEDLLKLIRTGLEIRCLIGQPLGSAAAHFC